MEDQLICPTLSDVGASGSKNYNIKNDVKKLKIKYEHFSNVF